MLTQLAERNRLRAEDLAREPEFGRTINTRPVARLCTVFGDTSDFVTDVKRGITELKVKVLAMILFLFEGINKFYGLREV